jgi:hypothetical protein
MRSMGIFQRNDLVLLRIGKPLLYDPADYLGEPWQSQICSGMAELNAANWEAGDDKIEVLITRTDLWNWRRAGQEMKATLSEVPVHPGRYGDSRWPGAELREVPGEPEKLEWVFL